MDDPTRRRFLYGGALTLSIGLAGCTGGDDGDGNDTEETDGDEPTDDGGTAADGDGEGMAGENETDGETDDGTATEDDVDGENDTEGEGDVGNETGDDGDAGNETEDDGAAGNETDGNGDTAGEDAPSIEDYPVVEEWLTETELGGADDSWDGTLADETGTDTVTIGVGAEGNDGAFAYEPSAVVITVGSTVEWNWTGEGNPHNVEALPAEQLGESDFEFSSGEAAGGSGVQYTRTFEETGVALYHCEPHYSLGMKGAIVVVE